MKRTLNRSSCSTKEPTSLKNEDDDMLIINNNNNQNIMSLISNNLQVQEVPTINRIVYLIVILVLLSIVRNTYLSMIHYYNNNNVNHYNDDILCINNNNNNNNNTNVVSTILKTTARNDTVLDESFALLTTIKNSNPTRQQQQQQQNEDLDSIRYVSGRIGDNNPKLDDLIMEQCSNQSGVNTDDPEQMLDRYCTGPITSIVQCCYCYENTYPAFVTEEISYYATTTTNHNNKNNFHHQQQHWQYHQSILQLLDTSDNNDNTETQQFNDTTTGSLAITDNSYHYEHIHPYSYYFCMEPRIHSINTNWTKQDIMGENDTRKLIVVTGKWGYKSRFKEEVLFICSQLRTITILDHVHCHYKEPKYIMDDTRFEHHLQYIYNKSHETRRGGGYWLHKASVVRHYMDVYNDNDYIIWVDIDTIHIFELIRFYKLLQTTIRRDADMVLEDVPFVEQEWTKEDILTAFNATKTIRQTRQISASVQLIKNSPHIRKYYDAIIDCSSDYHMISDEPSIIPNDKTFEENRHDQSILSMFYKTYLSNQTMIGPPVQGTADSARFYTFHLDPSIDVQCPFRNFYNTTLNSFRQKQEIRNKLKSNIQEIIGTKNRNPHTHKEDHKG